MSEPAYLTASVAQLRAALLAGRTTPVDLVAAYADEVARHNDELCALICSDDRAEAAASAVDARHDQRPLAGIPIAVKDNIATTGLPTTAGSRALARSQPDDAPLVRRLRTAGAVIVGKTNLSEWANFRSTHSIDGWSAVGGQTRNPRDPTRSTSGSSSGSAAAVAAGFVPLAIGTETDGSILSPAGMCGVVGFKPSLGAVPGEGIVPISPLQDCAGPMGRTVRDVALAFVVLAELDVAATMLGMDAAHDVGHRLAVWSPAGMSAHSRSVLDSAVSRLAEQGWSCDPVDIERASVEDPERPALVAEFRAAINDYLAQAPDAAVRTLDELIRFNAEDEIELSLFGQELLEQAVAAPDLDDRTYRQQRASATASARQAITAALHHTSAEAILTVTNESAQPIGDTGASWFSTSPAAVAGYPSITLPAGEVDGLPVGVTLIGPSDSDVPLLRLALDLETALDRAR